MIVGVSCLLFRIITEFNYLSNVFPFLWQMEEWLMTILQNPIEETNQFDKKQKPGQIGTTEESRIIFDFAS